MTAAEERGGPQALLNAGLVLVVLAVVPGLAGPFSVPKEAVVCFATAFALLLAAVRGAEIRIPWPRRRLALLFALPLALTATALLNGNGLIALGGVPRWWSYALYVLALRLSYPDGAAVERLFGLCAALGGIEGLLVVLQVLFGHLLFDTSQLPSSKWRAFGTLGNPNWAGAFLAATLPLALAQLDRRAGAKSFAGAASIAAIVAGLAVTLARGAWLAAAAGVAVLVFLSPSARRGHAWAVLAAGLAVGAAATWSAHGDAALAALAPGDSTAGRARMWRVTANMVAARPLAGWGPAGFAGHYPVYQRSFLARGGDTTVTDITDHPHNEYLYLAAEGGIVSAALLLALLASAALEPRPAAVRARLAAPIAALAALAVDALTDVPWHLPATAVLLCILVFGIFTIAAEADAPAAALPLRRGPIGRLLLAAAALLLIGHGMRWLFADGSLARARRALFAAEPAVAVAQAERGLAIDAEHGELWRAAAHARAAAGDDAGARQAAAIAMALAPGTDLAYLEADLARRAGRPHEAAAILREWSAVVPGLMRPHLLMAQIYADAGDVRAARGELQRAATMPTKLDGAAERELRRQAEDQLQRLPASD